MRTTITLDRDVAQRAKSAVARSGKSFKHVINEALRAGFELLEKPAAARPYRTKPMAAGLRPGISLDNVHELIAQLDGEDAK
jgi:hypothetical protein